MHFASPGNVDRPGTDVQLDIERIRAFNMQGDFFSQSRVQSGAVGGNEIIELQRGKNSGNLFCNLLLRLFPFIEIFENESTGGSGAFEAESIVFRVFPGNFADFIGRKFEQFFAQPVFLIFFKPEKLRKQVNAVVITKSEILAIVTKTLAAINASCLPAFTKVNLPQLCSGNIFENNQGIVFAGYPRIFRN